jgi:hypothetical protein
MDAEQPYRPPEADVSGPAAGGVTYGGGGESITPSLVSALVKTRPWVMLIGVMTMVGCGLLILVGIFMAFLGMGEMDDELGAGFGLVIAIVYLLMAFLYFFPGLYLLRYGRAIKEVDRVANGDTIESALRHQLAFWRFVGILTLVGVGLYVLVIVFGMFAAMMTGLNS